MKQVMDTHWQYLQSSLRFPVVQKEINGGITHAYKKS